MIPVWSTGHWGHVAVEGAFFLAFFRSRGAIPHLVGASGHDEGISPGDARPISWWEGTERVIPGTCLTRAAPRVGGINPASTLLCVASIWPDVIRPFDGGRQGNGRWRLSGRLGGKGCGNGG